MGISLRGGSNKLVSGVERDVQPKKAASAPMPKRCVYMLPQALQMIAVQMGDVAAAAAAQQDAARFLLMGAVLIHRAFAGADFVDAACLFQLFQLAVNGGKTHGAAAAAQLLCQIVGGESVFPARLQTVQHGLLLFGTICHSGTPENENENRFHYRDEERKVKNFIICGNVLKAVAKRGKMG